MRRKSAVVTAIAAVLFLPSCGSSATGPPSTSGAATLPGATSEARAETSSTTGITISGFAFSGTLTVKPGQKVTVTNKDSVAHTLTDLTTHKFDTGNIAPGGTGSFTAPGQAGSYPFGCRYHSNMKGTLTVQG